MKSIPELWDNFKRYNIQETGISGEVLGEAEEIFEEIIVDFFPQSWWKP